MADGATTIIQAGVVVLGSRVVISSMAGSISESDDGAKSIPWHRVLPASVLSGM